MIYLMEIYDVHYKDFFFTGQLFLISTKKKIINDFVKSETIIWNNDQHF